MKLTLLTFLIILPVMAGCGTVTGSQATEVYETVIITAKVQTQPVATAIETAEATTIETAEALQTASTKLIIEPVKDSVNTFTVYSPKIIIGNVPAGGHIDGVCINIVNRFLEPITVDVYPDRYGGESYDEANSKYYQPAPNGFEDFISIDHWGEYVIPEWSTLTLPINIDIPSDMSKFPASWEFHIRASMRVGDVIFSRIQRWLITMR